MRINEDAEFNDLFKSRYSFVLGKVNKRIRNKEDAEEVVSDIFLKVYNNSKKWENNNDKEYFEKWFNVVIRNAITDKLREYMRSKEVVPFDLENSDFIFVDESHTPEESVIDKEMQFILEESLMKVKNKKHRIAYILCHIEHYTIREIALILKQKKGTIKIWIYRCKEELRRILDGQELDF